MYSFLWISNIATPTFGGFAMTEENVWPEHWFASVDIYKLLWQFSN